MTGLPEPPTATVVGSWSCPTTIHAGHGAMAVLPGLVAGRPTVLVRDAAIVGTALPAGMVLAAEVVRDGGAGGWAFGQRIAAVLDAHPDAAVVAVGGGAVLDPARMAVLIRQDQRAGRQVAAALARPDAGPGLVFLPGPAHARAEIVCVPTTIGTAAEVSPVVVLPGAAAAPGSAAPGHRGVGATLVVSPWLRARVAVLDPMMTSGLGARTLALGLVEPLARVLVPAVAGQAVIPQDQLAAGLVAALVELGEQAAAVIGAGGTPDAAWRLAAALASATTHTAPLALGRPPLGHVLWPIATELAGAPTAGMSKAEAMAGLLPMWLAALGELPDGFGTQDRVIALVGQSPSDAAARLRTWLGACGLPVSTHIADPTGTAQRISARWAAGFGHTQAQWEVALLALARPGLQPAG